MIISKIENTELILGKTGEERAPGLHLSDIIKKMMFERDKKFNPENPMDMMRIEAGHTWEEVLAHALQRRELQGGPKAGDRPEPLQYQGVWMSPDWFNADSEWPVEEWKATKMSKKKDLEEHQWYWLVQLKGYMKGLSEQYGRPLLKGKFRVWYINGDYDWSAKVSDLTLLRDYIEYNVEFTQREIDDNWRTLMSNAIKYGLTKGEPTWEQQPSQTPPTSQSERSSKPPVRSPRRPKVITFPTTKMSLKRPATS